MGRVDLHNHLLFGLDDGATDAGESLALAEALVEAGFTDVVTTPHSKPEMSPDGARCAERLGEVQRMLDERQVALKLHAGREHLLTPEFLARVEAGEATRLAGGPYVLVELPFATPVPGLRDAIFKLLMRGVRPIIAHPERCAHFTARPEAAPEVVAAGAHLQIEIGSVAGLYGSTAKKLAQALLAENLVAVAATDAHRSASTREVLGSGLKVLERSIGSARLQLLIEENPARVLAGSPLVLMPR